jgi:hypothetical protein
VSAGAAGIVATGNITGGNLNSTGILSVTSNIIGGNVVSATTVSMSGNVNGANAAITNTLSAANVSVSSNLTGGGIGVPNYVVLSSPATISSATPANIGALQFNAVANQRYQFEAYVPLVPDGSMTVAPAVNFSAGTCNYTTETQTTATSAWSVASKTTSDDVATTYAMTGTTARTLRISGAFYHTANVTVAMRFQNSTGNIVAQTGAYLVYTRVA